MGEIHTRCGEHDVKNDHNGFPAQDSMVAKIILHPNYDPKTISYNLAILVMEKNFIYQRHIGPVCLPEPDESFDNDKDCWSSGWGANSDESDGQYSNTLKKIDMRIVPKDECRTILDENGKKALGRYALHSSFLCVGGEKDKDTCEGDGGSPHVCFNKDKKYVLVRWFS